MMCENHVITCESHVITSESHVITCESHMITCKSHMITRESHVIIFHFILGHVMWNFCKGFACTTGNTMCIIYICDVFFSSRSNKI